MKKNYKVKKNVPTRPSKKTKRATWKNHTSLFFLFGLAVLTWVTYGAFVYKTITHHKSVTNEVVVAVDPQSNGDKGEDTSEFNILELDLEQIEALANTIAGQNAVWPGYKGDLKDHAAVSRHFKKNFAEFINSGVISAAPAWENKSVAFAFAVSDTGVVQFVGRIPGGTLNSNYAYNSIKKGISGKVQVLPARDETGEPIIMLYYIKVRFSFN